MRERLGAALRQRRTELGWSAEAAGAVIAVSGPQWSKFERGVDRIAAEQLAKVCEAMGLSADSVLGLDGQPAVAPAPAEVDREVRWLAERVRAMSPRLRREVRRMVADLAATERPLA